MLMVADGRGRGVKNLQKPADVINGRPHLSPNSIRKSNAPNTYAFRATLKRPATISFGNLAAVQTSMCLPSTVTCIIIAYASLAVMTASIRRVMWIELCFIFANA